MEYSIDLELICDVLHKLAVKHRECFEQSGVREELDRSIFHDRVALGLRPEGHLDRCGTSNDLGISLYMRFAQWGKLEDLEEAIELHRAILNHWPQGHPDRSSSLNNLAVFLTTRFERYGRTSDLDEAIELHRATLELRPEGHPNRSSSLGNLATSLHSRFSQHGRLEDLDKAIEFHRAALELRPEGRSRSKLLNNLAGSLTTRFEKCGRTDDLDEAIYLYRSVLILRPDGHPLHTLSLNNLAASLQYRFRQCGRIGDLDKAIELQRAALNICPEDHPDRSASLNNLAISLQARFGQYGRIEDLDEAVERYRSALQLRPAGHPLHSSALDNLAGSLQGSFLQHRQIEDLNEAVRLHRTGLKFRPKGHPDRSMSLNNLANSLKTRFDQFRRIEDLNETIALHCDALEHLTEGHPDRPAYLSNIAASLSSQYEHHRRTDDLDKSTKLHHAALELCPVDHPLRSILLNNYANSLQAQFSQHGRIADLEEAIELHRAALKLRLEGHPDRSKSLTNLGFSLYSRFEKLGVLDDFEESVRLLEHASEHTFSSSVMRLESASLWANLARTHAHRTTSSAYKVAMMLLQRVLVVSPTLPAQLDFLKRNSCYKALSLDAAAYAIAENRLEEAIEILEQGRCLLWSQMRGFRKSIDQLVEVDRELAGRFKSVSRRLEALTTSTEGLASGLRMNGSASLASDIRAEQSFDEVLKLKKQLIKEQDVIINEIRRIPGFGGFLASTPLKVLRRAASEGPVIMVNHSKYRSDALIMLSCEDVPVNCVPLDDEFYRDSVELYINLLETRTRFTADSPEYDEKLVEVMKTLWDRVVFNVVDKLKELGIDEGSRVWWCPTSVLTALPFHAAGPFQDCDGTTKYLLDKYVSSYTPTLGALINARLGRNGGEPTVLVIGDTSLPSAKGEIRNIRNCGINTKLLLKNASHDAVIKALRRATWVHFVCHGGLDPKPFNSSFKVSDCGVTLLDIIQANLPNAAFAFLSACHTAEQPHDSAHDEVVHLAAAMQFSGFRSVIGSMWELLDRDGPHFAKAVYECMWECNEDEARYERAAAGLRKAAVELKARDGIRTERWVNLVHIGA